MADSRSSAGRGAPATEPWTDLPRAAIVDDFLIQNWAAASDRPEVAADVAAAAAARTHRDRLVATFPDDILVIPAGSYVRRSNDIDHPFRPHSAHVWLTGNQQPDAVLVLAAGEPVLFVRTDGWPGTPAFFEDRRYGEFWSGPRPSLTEVGTVLGLRCRGIEDLAEVLHGTPRVRLLRGVDPGVDRLADTATPAADRELDVELARLRIVKDDWELQQLQSAVDATVLGFDECVRDWAGVLQHGERWIEGTFGRRARVDGNGTGYSSIAASGAHATTLHWIGNDGAVRPGDLVLMDMGVEARSLYTADVTRTVPASGTWSSVHRDLYALVLAAQDAGIAAVRPGARFREFHRACVEVLVGGLADLGLLPCSRDEAMDESSTVYGRWVLCGSGHMLGLDVHDCRGDGRDQSLDCRLEPGMVLTVEPGLYLRADDLTIPTELRGIGIRIEDDLVVTATGNRNLSAGLPRTPEAIEHWLQQRPDQQ